jgi:hypothetical protein
MVFLVSSESLCSLKKFLRYFGAKMSMFNDHGGEGNRFNLLILRYFLCPLWLSFDNTSSVVKEKK